MHTIYVTFSSVSWFLVHLGWQEPLRPEGWSWRRLTSSSSRESASPRRGHDPLDGSAWARLRSGPRSQEAATALQAFGLAIADREDNRVQVTGWDARLLRRRLGALLAGVDDLQAEWDATAELVRYHRDRRVEVTGEDPNPSKSWPTSSVRCVTPGRSRTARRT